MRQATSSFRHHRRPQRHRHRHRRGRALAGGAQILFVRDVTQPDPQPSSTFLPGLLARLAGAGARRPGLVLLLALVLAVLSIAVARERLGISTDVDELFSASLPWKQRQAAFASAFPQFQDLVVVLVDPASLDAPPEAADEAANQLAAVLAQDHVHFASVRRPDSNPYFDREGLLFLDRPTLTSLLDHTIDAQPFLGQLAADPSARGLFGALSLLAEGARRGQADLTGFMPALEAFHGALAAAARPGAPPLSWQNLLGGKGLSELAGRFRFILVQPRLDYGAIAPGGIATDAIRAAAAALPDVRAGLARVRLTGSVPLADEEFATVAQGAVIGLLASLALVTLWLFLAVGSWRLVLPIVLTLLLGLLLTTLFAALAVGRLNLISVAFAILFVGIAVDFAIQFSVRFREQLYVKHERVIQTSGDAASGHHAQHERVIQTSGDAASGHHALVPALAETGRLAGGQILVAALATSAGFLAFVPTDFTGVAELGLIAGAGMLIAFACTLCFLPACLAALRPRAGGTEVGLAWAGRLDAPIVRHRRVLLALCLLPGLAGALLLPRLPFDSDPLHTKNPGTESMRALADLIANPLTSPYSVDILAANAPAADALAARLRQLKLVDSVTTLDSFVPTDQTERLALIADAASVLTPTLDVATPAPPPDAAALRAAATTAATALAGAATAGPVFASLAHDLASLAALSDPALLAASAGLTRYLPMQLAHLRTALSARPVTSADIPKSLARDWELPDGRVRVNAVARPGGRDRAGQQAFVAEVRTVAPDVGGSAVTIVATTDTIISAFRSAAIGALLAIAVILLVALRRLTDMALVLAPLLLSGLLTALAVVLLPLPINFANIIALPLLLGVGVSFNIYFVMNWRAGATHPLGSATARAVLFSALTTATAFGSLALSAHPGTASMGRLLLLSLGCTLFATLIFIPSLLACLRPPHKSP